MITVYEQSIDSCQVYPLLSYDDVAYYDIKIKNKMFGAKAKKRMRMSKKEGKKSRLVSMLANAFKFRFWLDTDRLKGFAAYIVETFQKLFVLKPQQGGELFAEAKERLKLDDAGLLERQKSLFRLSVLMVFFAMLILLYALYQLLYGSFVGVILSLVVMLIALTLAFRYHFWYFQLKEKKLGCSIREWMHVGLRGGNKS